MAEFARYYVEFLWSFVQNIWGFIKTIGLAFYKFFITDIGGYFTQLGSFIGGFDVFGWILLIFIFLINGCLIFFVMYRLVQLIRRYIFARSKEVEKDKLLEEIAKLKIQQDELMKEKKDIFALKVTDRIFEGMNPTGQMSSATEISATKNGELATKKVNSRFIKLAMLDDKYERNPSYIFMNESDRLTLPQIIDRFRYFSASQLRLYYEREKIMEFFSGLATSKILILEGISGTGKTSLPYAMGKFFNNPTSIVSVQPSWRDRAELLGYFNEFTKKFNETDFLSSLYEATLKESPTFIVLDEMNLARIEYYFADFLSIMEMPDVAEWKIDLVSESLATDPNNVILGKLLVPQNLWFVGTANNDDSTFTVTDKVYDRAVAIELNAKAKYYDAPMTESFNCTYDYLDSLFDIAKRTIKLTAENVEKLKEFDDFIQTKFKVAFGNRITKQINLFVPVYIACGGTEIDALDFMITTKILRKFSQLNLVFLTKELTELIAFIDKKFGKTNFNRAREFIKYLQKTI